MFFEYEKPPAKKSLDEYSLVSDNQINIPPHIWREIKEGFDKREVIEHLSSLIESQKLPYPSRTYTQTQLEDDFRTLCAEEDKVLIGDWECMRTVPDLPLTFQGQRVYVQATSKGMKVSDQFVHPHRMKCGHFEHKSPYREWTREGCTSKVRPVLRVLWTLNEEDALKNGVGAKQLRDCLRLGNYIASQFKPSCAKALYDFFQAKRVLDFSAGWGDRLVGFLASGAESYVGVDPNSVLQRPYQEIADFCDTGKSVKFICSPAEDADLTDRFDFIFTSPPYFNVEKYSEEDTQSWKRYQTIEAWLDHFFLPVLGKCWDALEEGGRLAINIADKGHSRGDDINAPICQPMLDYMEGLGAKFEGIVGYRMNKRPGDRMGETGGVYCEPIFIWSKGQVEDPCWNPHLFFSF